MHQTKKGHPTGCPFFVSMEFERLGLHGAADAGPGCPGGERRQWRMQRTGAGWAAAQSDASACYARSQRDTPQPDESLEVHHKKAGRLSCLFCCASPLRGRLHRSRCWRSGSAHRASQAKQYATGILLLTPSSGSAPQRGKCFWMLAFLLLHFPRHSFGGGFSG